MTETVTPVREYGSKSGMGLVGWVIAITIAIVLFPLLPIVLLIVVIGRLLRDQEQPATV